MIIFMSLLNLGPALAVAVDVPGGPAHGVLGADLPAVLLQHQPRRHEEGAERVGPDAVVGRPGVGAREVAGQDHIAKLGDRVPSTLNPTHGKFLEDGENQPVLMTSALLSFSYDQSS